MFGATVSTLPLLLEVPFGLRLATLSTPLPLLFAMDILINLFIYLFIYFIRTYG